MSEQSNIKRCSVCRCNKPATNEFFSPNGQGKLLSRCKECRNMVLRGDLILLKHICPDGHKRCTQCKRCKPATLEFFYSDKRKKDQLQGACKECCLKIQHHIYWRDREELLAAKRHYYILNRPTIQKRNKDWYANNKDQVRARRPFHNIDREKKREANRIWNQKNPDKVRASGRKWREKNPDYLRNYRKANPDKVRKLSQNWRIENSERYRKYKQEYTKANPVIFRASRLRRKARKRALPSSFSTADWKRALDYFEYRCVVCGRSEDDKNVLAADHWIALSDPRPDNPGTVSWNIVPLCNSLKGGSDGCNNSKRHSNATEWLTRKFGSEKAEEVVIKVEAYFQWVKQQG